MILEQITSIKLGDEARTNQLRHRYLTLMLEAMHRSDERPGGGSDLPGPPPTNDELTDRWRAWLVGRHELPYDLSSLPSAVWHRGASKPAHYPRRISGFSDSHARGLSR